MRKTFIAASTAALSLTAALLGGGVAHAVETTCTTYMLNERSTFSMDAKSAADREIHYVAHLYESTPGCYSSYYGTSNRPGYLEYGNYDDSGNTINYVGDGEFDVTQTLNYSDDALTVSWRGESRDYGDASDPGYVNPNSGVIDVRGHGYASVAVSVKKGVRTVGVLATRYSNSNQANIGWSRARVQIQELKGSKWITIKSTIASSAGKASVKVKTGKRAFRAVVATSDLAWGTTSKAVKK
jgi:hypothetical protein